MEYANYQTSFAEILEILTHISKEDYEKIPYNLIEVFEENASTEYTFKYDPEKSLEEQGCSEITQAILSLLYKHYWADDSEKRDLLLEDEKLIKEYQNMIREKYNPDDIFKNETEIKPKEQAKEIELTTTKSEKWYQKIFDFVKRFFKK